MENAEKLKIRAENDSQSSTSDNLLDISNSNLDLDQYLTFTLGKEEFGISIMLVNEIKAWTMPTRLPNVPPYLQGVVNLRGIIVPIIDLRSRFGMTLATSYEKNVIIFINLEKKMIGIIVDCVSDIVNVDKTKLKPAPHLEGQIKEEFINGLINLNGQMIVMLNIEKLFDDLSQSSEKK